MFVTLLLAFIEFPVTFVALVKLLFAPGAPLKLEDFALFVVLCPVWIAGDELLILGFLAPNKQTERLVIPILQT